MATIVTKTVGTGGDFTSLSSAVSWFSSNYPDFQAADIIAKIEFIENAEFVETSAVTIPDQNCSQTNYWWITVNPSVRHNGKFGTGARVSFTGWNSTLMINASYTIVEFLEITSDGTYATVAHDAYYADGVVLDSCLISGVSNATTIDLNDATQTNTVGWSIRNCIIIGGAIGVYLRNAPHYVQNCIIKMVDVGNTTSGIYIRKGNHSSQNTMVFVDGSGFCFQIQSGGFLSDTSNNVSSDSTAPGANPIWNALPSDYFVDYVNNDLSYKSTSPAIDSGIDLSAYFSHDIVGTSRPQGSGWDRGVFEYFVATSQSLIKSTSDTINFNASYNRFLASIKVVLEYVNELEERLKGVILSLFSNLNLSDSPLRVLNVGFVLNETIDFVYKIYKKFSKNISSLFNLSESKVSVIYRFLVNIISESFSISDLLIKRLAAVYNILNTVRINEVFSVFVNKIFSLIDRIDISTDLSLIKNKIENIGESLSIKYSNFRNLISKRVISLSINFNELTNFLRGIKLIWGSALSISYSVSRKLFKAKSIQDVIRLGESMSTRLSALYVIFSKTNISDVVSRLSHKLMSFIDNFNITSSTFVKRISLIHDGINIQSVIRRFSYIKVIKSEILDLYHSVIRKFNVFFSSHIEFIDDGIRLKFNKFVSDAINITHHIRRFMGVVLNDVVQITRVTISRLVVALNDIINIGSLLYLSIGLSINDIVNVFQETKTAITVSIKEFINIVSTRINKFVYLFNSFVEYGELSLKMLYVKIVQIIGDILNFVEHAVWFRFSTFVRNEQMNYVESYYRISNILISLMNALNIVYNNVFIARGIRLVNDSINLFESFLKATFSYVLRVVSDYLEYSSRISGKISVLIENVLNFIYENLYSFKIMRFISSELKIRDLYSSVLSMVRNITDGINIAFSSIKSLGIFRIIYSSLQYGESLMNILSSYLLMVVDSSINFALSELNRVARINKKIEELINIQYQTGILRRVIGVVNNFINIASQSALSIYRTFINNASLALGESINYLLSLFRIVVDNIYYNEYISRRYVTVISEHLEYVYGAVSNISVLRLVGDYMDVMENYIKSFGVLRIVFDKINIFESLYKKVLIEETILSRDVRTDFDDLVSGYYDGFVVGGYNKTDAGALFSFNLSQNLVFVESYMKFVSVNNSQQISTTIRGVDSDLQYWGWSNDNSPFGCPKTNRALQWYAESQNDGDVVVTPDLSSILNDLVDSGRSYSNIGFVVTANDPSHYLDLGASAELTLKYYYSNLVKLVGAFLKVIGGDYKMEVIRDGFFIKITKKQPIYIAHDVNKWRIEISGDYDLDIKE